MSDPWDFSKHRVTKNIQTNKKAVPLSSPNTIAMGLIRFFQKHISKVDGDRCQMYPSCSQYGYESFERHGFFLGFIMTADRLMRDNFEAFKYYPIYHNNGILRYYDPISANDFWWR
jgi:putative component of membrane protein insertase Oxa1/YidC/SpoIIIJ protein YidD